MNKSIPISVPIKPQQYENKSGKEEYNLKTTFLCVYLFVYIPIWVPEVEVFWEKQIIVIIVIGVTTYN